MNKQGWLCTNCANMQAMSFCSCGNEADVFLCGDCLPTHFSKNPGRFHINVPVAAYGQHKTPGYFNRLQERFAQISVGRQKLVENLLFLDACQKELRAKIENIISTLREYAEVTLNKLQLLRADLELQINAAIQEVEATVYMDKPSLKEKLARELWDFGYSFKSLKLFTYQVDQSPFPASLDHILHYSLSMIYGETGILPGINDRSLRLYDVRGGQMQHSNLDLGFTDGTVYCVIEGRTVLCVGGWPETSSVYSLTLSDAKLTLQQSMLSRRGWPGVIQHGSFVYVFGRWTGSMALSTCEKYAITTRLWSPLPDMRNPRCGFSPCLFEGEIYLPGIFRTHTVLEAFNPTREEFRDLPVPLPHTGYDSVSCILNGELIIVSRQFQICRRVMKSEMNFRVSEVRNQGELVLGSTLPVLMGKELYWVENRTGDLLLCDLETNAIRKIA